MKKINKNDPCPCGSGKTYGDCCQRVDLVMGKISFPPVDSSAAEKEDVQELFKRGQYYEGGEGRAPNYEKAIYWYQKAADAGFPPAICRLAHCYEMGRGTEQSLQTALELYQTAAEMNYQPATDALQIYFTANNVSGVEQAIRELLNLPIVEKIGEAMDDDLQVIGEFYREGLLALIEKNGNNPAYKHLYALFAQFDWDIFAALNAMRFGVEIAAKEGDPMALMSLGVSHIMGVYEDSSQEEGLRLLQQAAETGYDLAQYMLGLVYCSEMWGVKENKQKAFYWFKKAAEAGNAMAQLSLGALYGEADNPEEAFRYFKQAAEGGYLFAKYFLAGCYEFGDGTEESPEDAFYWYESAALDGYDESQYAVAVCYDLGDGVEQDSEKAVEWYAAAAEQGHAKAQYFLGEHYRDDDGVEPSSEHDRLRTALKWFRLAYENGVESAKDEIEKLENKLARLAWVSQKDVFISWNHENKTLREKIESYLKDGNIDAWQSDGECSGKITDACINAIKASRAWIVIVTENSLQSEWVAEEIDAIADVIRDAPELDICLIPVFQSRELYEKTKALCEKDSDYKYKKSFERLLDLGGIYGAVGETPNRLAYYDMTPSESDDERLLSLVKSALSRRSLIEYRKKCVERKKDFNAFVASRMEQSARFAAVGLKYNLEEGYVKRKVTLNDSIELSEEEFIDRLSTKRVFHLYAQGGAGKSLYLQNLVHTYFKAGRYIFSATAKELSEYLEDHDVRTGLLSYFLEDMNLSIGYGYKPDLTSVYSLFKLTQNEVIFIVDALDELGGDDEKLQKVRAATVDAYPESNVHFLFTSRSASDGQYMGAEEIFCLKKFSREDCRLVAKSLFDRFADKFKDGGFSDSAALFVNDAPLFEKIDELSAAIAENPLLITNFVILYLDHITGGGDLPKNEWEIAEKSIAFLIRDLEKERDARCNVDERVLKEDALNRILYDLAYRRATGDNRPTATIFGEYICRHIVDDENQANGIAADLLKYLRSRAIIVGNDNAGNVYHAIFRAYLAAQAIYNDCYYLDTEDPDETDVCFSVDKKGRSGEEKLRLKKERYFSKKSEEWADTEVFLVADLDKQIFSLPEIDDDAPLTSARLSYTTLKKTLDLLYSDEVDRSRHAFSLLSTMLKAKSLYNIRAIKEILHL